MTFSTGRRGNFIENERAWQAGKDAAIKRNRAKSGRARWLATHADAQKLYDWLFRTGDFGVVQHIDPRCTDQGDGYIDHHETNGDSYYGASCNCCRKAHPLVAFSDGEFLDKMRAVIDEWGGLTDGQHAAVAKSFAKAQELLATRDQRNAERKAADVTTAHVGKVGDRADFTLTVERVLSFDGQYGTTYFNICRDADRNIVVYKGSNGWAKGDVVTCKATIKAHDHRDGVPQTIISRPKVSSVVEA